jgi:hypothetical protein
VVNLLQLTIPLYMRQVFDRVMAARSADILLWLTLLALAALLQPPAAQPSSSARASRRSRVPKPSVNQP